MNKKINKEWVFWILTLIPFAVAFILYPHMPEQMPIHWNAYGVVDGYGSRLVGVFLLPLVNLVIYFFLLVIPRLDPKKQNYEKFQGTYRSLRYLLHTFFLFIFGLIMAASLGYAVDMGLWIFVSVCLLLIFIGNMMGRVRHNYFVGIRLPWTLASEEVWKKTHQFGSKVMVAGALFALIGSFLTMGGVRVVLLLIGILVPIVAASVYSYIVFRRLN